MADEIANGATFGGGRYIKVPGGYLDTHAGGGPAPGVTPKGSTAAINPPAEPEATWGEVGTDIAKNLIPDLARGGTMLATSPASAADLTGNLVSKGADYIPGSTGQNLKAVANKVRDWAGPYSYGPVMDKLEESYNRFRPNPETHFPKHTTDTGGLVGKGIEALPSALPSIAFGGGPLAARVATTLGGIGGGEAGGALAAQAGEGYRPYGQLAGSLMGVRAPQAAKRTITPFALDAATKAERDAAVAKIGDKNFSAGQYTQSPWLLQKEGNAAPLHPSASFKQGQAEQPEAIARALFNELGGGGQGKVKTRAELGAAQSRLRDEEEALKELNLHPTQRTPHPYDPDFNTNVAAIQQRYHGTGKAPDPANPKPVDKAIDKIRQGRAGLTDESYSNLRTDLANETAMLRKKGDSRSADAVGKLVTELDNLIDKAKPGAWKGVRDKWEAYNALKKSTPDTGIPVDARTVANNVRDINSPIGKLSSAAADMATPLPPPKRGSNWPQFVTGAAGMLGGHLAGADTATSGILGMMGAAGMEAALNHGPRYLTSKMYTNPLVQKYFKNQVLDNKSLTDPKTALAMRLMAVSQANDALDPMPEPTDPLRGKSPLFLDKVPPGRRQKTEGAGK